MIHDHCKQDLTQRVVLRATIKFDTLIITDTPQDDTKFKFPIALSCTHRHRHRQPIPCLCSFALDVIHHHFAAKEDRIPSHCIPGSGGCNWWK